MVFKDGGDVGSESEKASQRSLEISEAMGLDHVGHPPQSSVAVNSATYVIPLFNPARSIRKPVIANR